MLNYLNCLDLITPPATRCTQPTSNTGMVLVFLKSSRSHTEITLSRAQLNSNRFPWIIYTNTMEYTQYNITHTIEHIDLESRIQRKYEDSLSFFNIFVKNKCTKIIKLFKAILTYIRRRLLSASR